MPVKTKDRGADDSCAGSCPVARTARLIEGKWTTQIIRDLMTGTKRYSQLQQSLEGISPKVLAARLRFLEMEGLITRTVYPEVPPHTDYRLTEQGLRLRSVLGEMANFGRSL